MQGKNGVSSLLKEYIVKSLLLLLKEHSINEISIKEITEKAGVNRSTYYRNFSDKTDIIRCYYSNILNSYFKSIEGKEMSPEEYLTGLFESFYPEKDDLILLYKSGLSYLLLDVMNSMLDDPEIADRELTDLYFFYHVGGAFNAFQMWMREDMKTNPKQLAAKCMRMLPKDFSPILRKYKPSIKQ